MNIRILKAIFLTMMLSMAFIIIDAREFTIGIKDTRYISHAENSLNSPNPSPGENIQLDRSSSTTSSILEAQSIATTQSDTDETYVPSISPCKETISFTIGTFDPQFGISKEDFIKTIESAGMLWEEPVNKNLFKYDVHGALVINLIYDDRQERTVDIGYLGDEIENSKNSAETLKKEYEADKVSYEADGEEYAKDSALFKEKFDDYERRVKEYNTKGGAPRDVYEKMTQELEDLKKESAALELRRLTLLKEVDSINQKVARYNEFVVYINSLIKKSNTIGAKKFTEGRFTPSNNTIDIYQFSDRNKLKRVIAHELGHVLGIMHNNNKESIMYSVNAGTSLTLSKEDKVALLEACK